MAGGVIEGSAPSVAGAATVLFSVMARLTGPSGTHSPCLKTLASEDWSSGRAERRRLVPGGIAGHMPRHHRT